jgi:hypothetical protein
MRAQIAIEMFFAFSILSLVMLWLASYLNLFSPYGFGSAHFSLAAFNQGKTTVREVASLANQVCVSEASASFVLPCARSGENPLYYAIQNQSPNSKLLLLSFRGFGVNASASASCFVDANVSVGCGNWAENNASVACFRKESNVVRIRLGSCG